MTEKDKFLAFLKKEEFDTFVNQDNSIYFVLERMRLELEDDNWDDISFDVFMESAYITCVTTVKELKQLLKVLSWI